jgi:hypothetical protein
MVDHSDTKVRPYYPADPPFKVSVLCIPGIQNRLFSGLSANQIFTI